VGEPGICSQCCKQGIGREHRHRDLSFCSGVVGFANAVASASSVPSSWGIGAAHRKTRLIDSLSKTKISGTAVKPRKIGKMAGMESGHATGRRPGLDRNNQPMAQRKRFARTLAAQKRSARVLFESAVHVPAMQRWEEGLCKSSNVFFDPIVVLRSNGGTKRG